MMRFFRKLCGCTVDSAPGRYVALNRTSVVKVKIIDLEKKKAKAVFVPAFAFFQSGVRILAVGLFSFAIEHQSDKRNESQNRDHATDFHRIAGNQGIFSGG